MSRRFSSDRDSSHGLHERPYEPSNNSERHPKRSRHNNYSWGTDDPSNPLYRVPKPRKASQGSELDEFGRDPTLRPPPGPRTPTDPRPPPQSVPSRTPAKEYLISTSTPSMTLPSSHPPTALPRKLVIFDLNGTLLRRSPRTPSGG